MAHIDENQSLFQSEEKSELDRVEKRGLEGAEEGQAAGSGSTPSPTEGTKDAAAVNEGLQDPKAQSPAPSPAVAANNPRPTLVQLGNSSSTTPTAQHKKFSASNINKKFLEKTSASGSAANTSNASGHKVNGPTSRPTAALATSHSRLVTTKLTATPQSSSPGPGWSRPSSATPTVASNASPILGSTPNGTSPLPPGSSIVGSTGAAVVSSSAAQLPHVGKVIQPQPRSALLQISTVTPKGSPKPVWGNVKGAAASAKSDETVQNDFPTAAEVAQGASLTQKSKAAESKGAEEVNMANKAVRNEEAESFRGVHLDPNAHHWDEMEEDDDNFLDGVIEFNDGRQYKIEASASASSPPRPASRESSGNWHSRKPSAEVPVTKEERFAEDFDRSWPRSKPSPSNSSRGLPSTTHHAPPSALASPILSQHHHSPTESSRVLFNERSNRLEPYSAGNSGFRPTHDQPHSSKRSDYSTSPSDFRRGRDLPPHASGNVQLLQKQGADYHSAVGNRNFARRDSTIRDPTSSSHPPLRSPRISDSFSGSQMRERDTPPERGRRLSNMGPPPVPLHARDSEGRQLPPHLSQASPKAPIQRLPSRDRYPQPPTSAKRPPSLPAQSPVLSHASPASASGAAILPPSLAPPEIDSLRKDLMHDAAERAKQRRQAEEAEREKERERARQKAAEMASQAAKETKPLVKESEVISVIEEAIATVDPSAASSIQDAPGSVPPTAAKPPLKRPPSLRGIQRPPTDLPRPGFARRNSNAPITPTSATTPAAQANSWRNKANPVSAQEPAATSMPPAPLFSGPTAQEQADSSFTQNAEENLEVVDFSDLGKFVGVSDSQESAAPKEVEATRSKPNRPLAIDFFQDHSDSPNSAAQSDTWKRKPSLHQPEAHADDNAATDSGPRNSLSSPRHTTFESSGMSDKEPSSPVRPNGHGQVVTVPHTAGHGQQRTPRSQTFPKEATMSALDDAISRIKGAIDGMHESQKDTRSEVMTEGQHGHSHQDHPPTVGKSHRWVPPALRINHEDSAHTESLSTRCEPPLSPRPAWNTYHVRLPKVSVARPPVHKQQLSQFHRGPSYRSVETLSIDPPVNAANRRDFSLNDILFWIPGFKGKPRYRVYVPRLSASRPNGPSGLNNNVGAFGKPPSADTSSSWRKPVTLLSSPPPAIKEELETTSRSPPPSTAVTLDPAPSKPEADLSKQADHPVRQKVQRKMPNGAAVAVYRDSRVVNIEAKPAVNFIVGSELDGPSNTSPEEPKTAPVEASHKETNGDITRAPETSSLASSTNTNDSKASIDHVPRTPSSNTSNLWASPGMGSFPVKESPAREGVDHPHIKELWTNISANPSLPTINSLEKIEDDLPALPLTLQDVKSEGGETPPPQASTSSRISSFDVTRGFQQVPPSTSSTSQRPSLPPATPSAPIARPSSYGYPVASPSNANWQAMPQYNYPMMPHGMYPPSPVPGRMPMNGQAAYAAWIPAPPTPGQGMVRQMTPSSPFPVQMVAYPPPGTPTLYNTAAMSPQMQQAGIAQPRSRNAPIGSPVVAPAAAHPYYAGSHMMMQSPIPHPQNHAYITDQNRGHMRHDNGHPPMQRHPAPSYGQTPSTPFPSRPW
ncbi:hypothetical protein PC9H_003919 [Pleurotus ostreatus]|uniref:Uncharacterized protein n=1 Tax=Pleurotus ostreatus TaxID=5322 RepID=A0A8H7A6P8_PLEOS|nr:uncharacterized protein PC9H_003919 [Pleurotus ostreatus]KAF7437085.1 hypothetical protein PC9H_003919 [Pleurotus ostreatus]